MLFATYGTQFVNLRVVLENNNLMRLFNFSHRQACAWLDKNKQNEFSLKIQSRFKKCKSRKHFGPSSVLKKIHKKTGHINAKINTAKIYGQLCDYTHPNFLWWQELMGIQGSNEVLLDLPVFLGENTDNSLKVMLYLILYLFKTFVETFNIYIDVYTTDQLTEWQEKYNKIMPKYMGK